MKLLKSLLLVLATSTIAFAGVMVQEGDSPGFGSVTASSMTVTGNGIKLPDGTVITSTAPFGGGGSGSITGVVAGFGLTGGGTSGSVTLAAVSTTVYTTKINTFSAAQAFGSIDASSMTLSGNGIQFPDGTVLVSTANLSSNMGLVSLSTGVVGILGISNGGNGTDSPGLVEGANVTITGSWPTQSISAVGGSSIYPSTSAPTFPGLTTTSSATISNALITATQPFRIYPSVDAVNGIDFEQAGAGSTILHIDTQDRRVGILTSTPSKAFEVGGDALIDGVVFGASGVVIAAFNSGTIATLPTTAGYSVYNTDIQSLEMANGSAYQAFVTTTTTNGQGMAVTLSSTTITGYVQLATKTHAEITALTPGAVNEEYGCSDCATVPVCISTGTAAGAWSLITARASACQ